MRKTATHWIGLVALCVICSGCGGESTTSDQAQGSGETEPKKTQPMAMVLETSEASYWRDGEEARAIEDVRAMIVGIEPTADAGFTLSIDPAFERTGQLRVVLTPAPEPSADPDLKVESDKLFDQLKTTFDQRAKDAALQEEAHHREQAAQIAKQVKQLQEKLQGFLEISRGSPSTDASRLERRTLERQIETALVEQIASEKAAEKAQRRTDRKRFITLLRVR